MNWEAEVAKGTLYCPYGARGGLGRRRNPVYLLISPGGRGEGESS
jgi:hypothetical protein